MHKNELPELSKHAQTATAKALKHFRSFLYLPLWMIRRARQKKWQYQRNFDLNVLWPECKKLAPSLDVARAAFAVHAFNDAAWIEHYGEEKLKEFIGRLE